MLNFFIFLLNAVFFGTFYANMMKHHGAGKPNLVQTSYAVAISGIKNDAIFNVYLPLLADIFQVSNAVVIQIAFVCAHCFIINRSGITSITYFIFHIEHIIVLSFFFIGANHLQQIMMYFFNFIIVHSICAIRHKKLI
jgi:hypothetical protein